MNKYVCIHGHFYQPPRENAWLEKVELQDSAYPFHDWNERITQECYYPNSASRILEDGVIKDIVNNYAGMSFNFGPTLLSWLEEMAPNTYKSILEADKLSMDRFSGHGSAMAQAYNHMILPLANERDKETQVVWGIRDFEKRFARYPEGMWLGETAVNTETLEVLAKYDIKFTVMAPRQASKIRKIGDKEWVDVSDERVDPRRPYICNLPSGKSIALFFYDGGVSKDVAFNKLLNNGMAFAERLLAAHDKNPEEPQLAHIATDGESYGHHHRHGEMALSYCLDYIENQSDAWVINYGKFLEIHPPTWEAQIIENSSWSCVHGIERWRSDCGCHTGGEPGWNQKWREPLRDALDWLRDRLIKVFDTEGKDLFHDPWKARNEYIEVIMDRDKDVISNFFEKHCKNVVENGRMSKALRLLECQRQSMLMYTSCGWFFNEVTGIETLQILEYASRAIQLNKQIGMKDLENEFIDRLRHVKSNIAEHGDLANIYRKETMNTRLNLMKVGMHYGVESIFEDDPENITVFNYSTQIDFFDKREAGMQKIAFGRINIKSNTTYSEKHFSFVSLYLGQHNLIGYISVDMEDQEFYEMYNKIRQAFSESNVAEMMQYMNKYFGDKRFSIWHLFKDEKRKVFDDIMSKYLVRVNNEMRQIYDQDYQLVNAMSQENIPIPEIYLHTFKHVMNAELKECLENDPLDTDQLEQIVSRFKKWDMKLSKQIPYSRIISNLINKNLDRLSIGSNGQDVLQRLNKGIKILKEFKVNPDLHVSQNLYFQVASKDEIGDLNPEMRSEFNKLGKNLGIKTKLLEA
jgi:alpha-amylase/alpha-mannosidase (GH57 family)